MPNNVEYELSLKDSLSPKIDQANAHIKTMESSFHGLKEMALHTVEALGISFAIFKGMGFIHEGVEAVEKLHEAEAQLSNTMQNMGTYSEEAFEKIIKGSAELSKNIKFSRSEVIELRSQLGLVGNIGEQEMGRLTKVSADLATKFGMGLTEAGNALAKAVNNPEMARRLGMQLKIDPAIMAHIKNLADHGKEAQARLELIQIAEAKVGGAAEAAFNANPLSRFNKVMASIKLEVGDAAVSLLKVLAPALEWVGDSIKGVIAATREMVTWGKQHRDLMVALAWGIGTVITAWALYHVWMTAVVVATKSAILWQAIELASINILGDAMLTASAWTKIMAAAQWALNVAMEANPIGLIVAALAVVITSVVYCYNHFKTFRAILWSVWAVIKEFGSIVGDIFVGLWHTIHGVFTLSPNEIKLGSVQMVDAMFNAGQRLGKAAKDGYAAGMVDFDTSKANEKKGLVGDPKTAIRKAGAMPVGDTEKNSKAVGHKSVVFNIKIGNVVGQQTFSVTNIKESLKNVREQVTAAIISSVNDFQIVAGE